MLQELVSLLVEKVETADTHVAKVTWVPAARPFFAAVSGDSLNKVLDALAWYAAV